MGFDSLASGFACFLWISAWHHEVISKFSDHHDYIIQLWLFHRNVHIHIVNAILFILLFKA